MRPSLRPLTFGLVAAALVLAGCSSPGATTSDGDGTPATPRVVTRAPDDTGLGSVTPTPSPATPEARPIPRYGVAMSPSSYEGEGFAQFFTQAEDVGGLLLWGGDAGILADTLGAADIVASLAKQHDLAYGVQLGFHHEGAAFDKAAQAKAANDVLQFVNRTHPAFIVLGVELDRINDKDPAFIDAFVPWYLEMYSAIKDLSPATYVFPSFQYENTRGFQGGMFGEVSKGAEHWSLIDRFVDRDMTAFTTYPSLLYISPGAIPEGYYDAIREHVPEGPVGFTEIGWHAAASPRGWESSPDEQAEFIQRFVADADRIEAKMLVWVHLHDQPTATPEPFATMGLVGTDGVKRPAYDAWVAAVAAEG